MSKDNGGQAFPCRVSHHSYQSGMSLRDYFAAKAMQGILASPTDGMTYVEIAENSYRMADAMLKEREK